MNIKELITDRYSVRSYLPKNVESEKINFLLECARLAPSAVNYQPWHFYVVTDDNLKKSIQESYNRDWFKTAPMYIVACKDSSQSWKRGSDGKDYGDVDLAIAVEHICLAATFLGLGTCWVCNFDLLLLSKALELPDSEEPVVIIPIGYIDEQNSESPSKKRKDLSEIVTWR